MANPSHPIAEVAERVAEQLETIRRSCGDQPEDERRSRFRQALEKEIGGLPDADASQVLQAVRDRLIHDARTREQRIAELEQQVAWLRDRMLQSARAREERVAELEQQVAQLRDQLAAVSEERDRLTRAGKGPQTP